ncbi:MAG: class I SAM-dependent rRNA methyltransferase [Akkermansiaceae bacterium]|nr:class I SAM-dependent rRNA methyltransferase [Akkermansiaceae bacterium]
MRVVRDRSIRQREMPDLRDCVWGVGLSWSAGMARRPLKVRLFPRAESTVRSGHPWVFKDSVKSVSDPGSPGDLAVVYDRQDRMMGMGFWDPDSPIALRMIHVGAAVAIDREWWLRRMREAVGRRDFEASTDGYRCLNGDSEGFPGLVVDRYADTWVVKVYSAAWLVRWAEIEEVIREIFAPLHLVRRIARNLLPLARELGLEEGFCGAEGREIVVFREHGIRFEAMVRHGQKTGFFLDQRDNRNRVAEMAAGREVLNVFSFSGGFSLHAAKGGAQSVTDVDISEHALAGAVRNFALNPGLRTRHETVQADAFAWMAGSRRQWDLIVVDPPSLAKREKDRAGALAAYRKLQVDAIRCLRPGGILVSASCSAHVRKDEFFKLVSAAAVQSGRKWREIWRSGHAADHPAGFPEAEYLKAMAIGFP